MNFRFGSGILLAGMAASVTAMADVMRHPLNTGIALEYGSIYKSGNLFNTPPAAGSYPIRKATVKRTIGWFLQSATIDERLDVIAGLGGVFLYLYPDEGYAYQRLPLSAVSLIQASGAYTWGDLQSPALKLSFGFMPYKYNPDVKNVGEYLFRSTPYPGTVTNGSWNLVNSAQAKIWGVTLSKSFLGGKWKNDLLVSVSDYYPLYDFSPAFITSFKAGMLEVGGGVNFYHLIPNDDKVNTRKIPTNAHFAFGGEDYYAYSAYYTQASALQTGADSASSVRKAFLVDSLVGDSILAGRPPAVPLKYYTVGGTLLMARFTLDFAPLLGEKLDLKLYGETSLLGLKDYAVFYEKKSNRMPMMLGLNLPTWGLLDVLSAELEYWKNPYINSYFNVIGKSTGAVPDFETEAVTSGLNIDPTKDYTKDDFVWAVTATRSLGKNVSITFKAARDHLTQLNAGQGFGTELQTDILPNNKGWYYVLHVQAAI